MSRRPTLLELRGALVVYCLDDHTWKTPTECAEELGLDHGGYRVALTLERLAHDGHAELERPGSRVGAFDVGRS